MTNNEPGEAAHSDIEKGTAASTVGKGVAEWLFYGPSSHGDLRFGYAWDTAIRLSAWGRSRIAKRV